MDPIRVGGIGCGPVSTTMHLSAIQRVPELELVALCDIDEARLA
jgi:predicted dehydrogenase